MLLLIDNYDSFTYNLVHFLGDLGARCIVHRNDQITVDEAMALKAAGIVLSPGPCTPNEAGICMDLVRAAAKAQIPVLGVCLGHQAIGQAFGGKVVRAPVPMHGKLSEVRHSGQSVFEDVPSPFKATRYHSLVVGRAGRLSRSRTRRCRENSSAADDRARRRCFRDGTARHAPAGACGRAP